MSEKELKEMMVSEETDHDDVEKEIDDLNAEIDKIFTTEFLPYSHQHLADIVITICILVSPQLFFFLVR